MNDLQLALLLSDMASVVQKMRADAQVDSKTKQVLIRAYNFISDECQKRLAALQDESLAANERTE